MTDLLEAERTAYCELLAAREEEREFQHLETAIFEAWLAASKSSSTARKREDAAFDTWYAASKALDNKEPIKWPMT